jgi:hypothetical protein
MVLEIGNENTKNQPADIGELILFFRENVALYWLFHIVTKFSTAKIWDNTNRKITNQAFPRTS